MNRKTLFILAVLIAAFVTLACGVQFNLPSQDIKTGPLQTQAINVELPTTIPTLNLKFGAGGLTLSPGANDVMLVNGEAVFNVSDLAPVIKISNDVIEISTGDLQINGIPKFQDDIRNEWNLFLSGVPMALKINAGAYKGNFDFGGLALSDLEISDGASDVNLNFSSPNKTRMQHFSYETGASKVIVKGLANANFKDMTFRSGAGSYWFDFSGDLKIDSYVVIESGLSKITIVIPEGINAVVQFSGELNKVNTFGLWKKDGSQYILEGTGPMLTIEVKIAAGTLDLKN